MKNECFTIAELYTAPKVVEIRSNGEEGQTTAVTLRDHQKTNKKNFNNRNRRPGTVDFGDSEGNEDSHINSIASNNAAIPHSANYPHGNGISGGEWSDTNNFWGENYIFE